MVLRAVFWISFGAIAYHYIGYPIVLFLFAMLMQSGSRLALLLGRKPPSRSPSSAYQPSVAILISAFNEEGVIGARVKNTLDIDYPAHLVEVLIGLDSPTDSTSQVLNRVESSRVRVFNFPTRRGKLAVLQDLAQQTAAEILVFTDAETMFAPDCIQKLVRHFADSAVGVVGGELRVFDREGKTPVEGLYWRYELLLKSLESRLNCVCGVVGAVYAVRSALWHLQKPSFAEDFQLPMEIRGSGRRVVYDPGATATETVAPTFSAEFRRRIRLGAADYQALTHNPGFLNPLKGLPIFSYFSHKVLRWLGPFLLLTAFVSNLWLVSRPLYFGLFVTQTTFYMSACMGYLLMRNGKSQKLLSIPLYFCAMNLALLYGFFRFLRGQQKMAWDVTPRTVKSVSTPLDREPRSPLSRSTEF